MMKMKEKNGGLLALAPIAVFVILYLGLGILFEYVMDIEMGFYHVPIVVMFLIALAVACVQHKGTMDEKLELMGKGIGDPNIVFMLLIFVEAGIFVGVVGRGSAQSVAYCMLSIFPAQYSVAILFIVSCLVSISMGTSVGTITLIVPIGISLAEASGVSIPLVIGNIMGGAMFGDNLSFISDTTIAACKGQGCMMKDKFKENFFIALPPAILSLAIIFIITLSTPSDGFDIPEYSLIQIVPYVLVFAGGLFLNNVLFVLLIGIVSGIVIMIATGALGFFELVVNMGNGAAGMFETSMVAILVAALCALIRDRGGFDALLGIMFKYFKGTHFGQLGMGILVVILDVATANNTVAIVMANPIAKEMAQTYKISSRRSASILDIFSCVAQGILPYGAQMLVAISAAAAMGQNISSIMVIRYLYYPYLLLVSVLISIFVFNKKEK